MHAFLSLTQLQHLIPQTVPLGKQQQAPHVDILDADVAPLEKRMAGRHVSIKAVVEELLLLNAVGRGPARQNRRVEHVAAERADDVGRHQLANLQLDVRVVAGETGHETVQQVRRDRRNHAQTKHARYLPPQIGHRLAHHFERLDRLAGLPDHDLARIGSDDGFAATVEQYHAELLLQILDLHAQRGLGNETFFGGKRETAAIGYRQQIFQLYDRHIAKNYMAIQRSSKNTI